MSHDLSEVAASGSAAELGELFRAHRGRLWGIAYRLTGSPADADDVVQEAFARLIDRAPEGVEARVGPWLVRVATNLGIDVLRERRRRKYSGPWLPAPAELGESGERGDLGALDAWPASLRSSSDPEARYDLRESATFAFLLALEALGPRQRAALLLRDVLGYSAAETAAVLGTSEGNVRVLHTRARHRIQSYDQARCVPTQELRERHREAIERFMSCLVSQDQSGLEALLAESVRTVTDANGEYTALAQPLQGRQRVAHFYLRAAMHRASGDPSFETHVLNGLPASVITLARPVRRQAPRSVILLDLDDDGAIRAIHTILAERKLAAVRFRPAAAAAAT